MSYKVADFLKSRPVRLTVGKEQYALGADVTVERTAPKRPTVVKAVTDQATLKKLFDRGYGQLGYIELVEKEK